MPKYASERPVTHSAEEMFALVANIEDYPKFVPLCQALVVRGHSKEGDREIVVADMTVAYGPVRETFTTRVTLYRPGHTIAASYLDGPFRHLDSSWSFVSTGEKSCTVHFAIDYEFRSRSLGLLMGSVFDTAFRKFAGAFEARADAVYGRGA
ncbi:MAG TPA: SRPBCC family protein [Bauldia sp.]|jgi:coenzyme Q-binding protein COQ10